MRIQEHYSLKNNNAFKVAVNARYFTVVNSTDDLSNLITDERFKNNAHYILGEGANTLFTKDFEGFVIKMAIKGIQILSEDEEAVLLEVGGGESWIGLVQYCINNHLAGIENLNLIPGTVGAAPVQNIAAYGQNFEDVFVSLDAFNLETANIEVFDKEQCKFGYRSSIFKKEARGKYLVTAVRIRLFKNEMVNTSYHSRYGSVQSELEQFTKPPYSIRDIAKAIARIRERKFPDWEKEGTAGSFFLNPVITKEHLAYLQEKAPGLQFYPVDKLTYAMPDDPSFNYADHVKVAAGWLLEELGWKGKRIGNVGTSNEQALVVINYGGASAEEILDFTHKMQKDFKNAYNIELEPEVNIV